MSVFESMAEFYLLALVYSVGIVNIFGFSTAVGIYGLFFYIPYYVLVLCLVGVPVYFLELSLLMKHNRSMLMRCKSLDFAFLFSPLIAQALVDNLIYLYRVQRLCVLMSMRLWHMQTVTLGETKDNKCLSINETFELCNQLQMPLSCQVQSFIGNRHDIFMTGVVCNTAFLLMFAVLLTARAESVVKVLKITFVVAILTSFLMTVNVLGGDQSGMTFKLKWRSLDMRMLAEGLTMCLSSVSLVNCGVAAMGSRAGKNVKDNVVAMVGAICFSDFAICVYFLSSNFSRRQMIAGTCNVTGRDYTMPLAPTDSPTSMDAMQLELFHSSKTGMLEIMDAIVGLSRDPGSVPWTVCLVLVVNTVALLYIACCFTTLVAMWETVRSLGNPAPVSIGLFLLQAFVMASLEGLTVRFEQSSILDDISGILRTVFFSIRAIECGRILYRNEIYHFILDRRSLIPAQKTIHLLLFDWYLVPTITVMLVCGYALLALMECRNWYKLATVCSAYVLGLTVLLPLSLEFGLRLRNSKKEEKKIKLLETE